MKLLVALTYYHPHWTGLTKVARRVAEEMADRGHEVTVLTSRYRADLAAEETVNGVRVIRLPVLARLSRGVLMPTFPAVARRLVAAHDVVQIHTPMLEAPLLTAFARSRGARAVITHHGDLVMPRRPFDRLVERLVSALLRSAFRGADQAIVYTDDYLAHSRFLGAFAQKCTAIWPPVEMPLPEPAGVARWRAELGLDGRRLIGFAGRFVEEKGFDQLFMAARRLVQTMPDVTLVFAGERDIAYESFFAACRPLLAPIESHVVFVGLLDTAARLANFYAMCDVVAVPSRSDNLPLVPLEAMLCGTPVVVSDVPGARMAVKVAGMGRLVPANDPDALASGLEDVLRHRERYVRPRAEVEQRFAPRRSLDEYERVLAPRLPRP